MVWTVVTVVLVVAALAVVAVGLPTTMGGISKTKLFRGERDESGRDDR